MITRILLFGLIIAGLSSCATYRTGQTPDDVYYSPEREAESYVQTNRDEDGRTSYNDNSEDRRIRQQIRDQRFRSFDDDYYWNSPRYNNGWGWNNWNNTWSNNCCCNSNYGHGYGYNKWGLNNWNSSYIFIPGTYSTIVIGGPSAPRNSTGIRYSAPIQRFNTSGTSNGKYVNTGNGSRYFGGANNNNNGGGRRTSFFGGGSNNNSGSGSRTFGNSNSSSSGSGSRTFGNTGGSSNSSSSGSSGSSSNGKSAGGRRN